MEDRDKKDESDRVRRLPYREGEPSPKGNWVLVEELDDDGKSKGRSWVDPTSLKNSGPLQHEDVDDLLPALRWTWRHLRRHLKFCRSFEDWELGFLRDGHPDKEIALWLKHTYAYLEFLRENPKIDRDLLFSAIMHLSQGRGDQIQPQVGAERLAQLMSKTPRMLGDMKKYTPKGRLKTHKKHLQ